VQNSGRLEEQINNRYKQITDANDAMAFATSREENDKNNKKKEFTCYKCKKITHYSNVMNKSPSKHPIKKSQSF